MNDFSPIPVVIPCGGMGTRIREASDRLPKPLIEVGGRPILWHIMKIYESHGFRRFVLPLGYKGELVKDFFLNYRQRTAKSMTVGLTSEEGPTFHDVEVEDWEVTLVDTGLETGTGGRLGMIAEHLDADHFLLTYGDGVADIDLTALMETHRGHDRLATVTGVRPTSRFGELKVDGHKVESFDEKPALDAGLINGGFFAFDRAFLDYVTPDSGMLETDPLPKAVANGQLAMYHHEGFWQSMDTYREYVALNAMWDEGIAPWKRW